MATAVVIDDTLTIPGCDGLAAFRGWTRSPDFPSTGRIDWIAGSIDVDMSPENLFTHGTLKTEIAAKIYARVRAADLGEVFIDRTRLVCPAADLSAEPDVVFVSHAAVEAGRARFVPAAAARAMSSRSFASSPCRPGDSPRRPKSPVGRFRRASAERCG